MFLRYINKYFIVKIPTIKDTKIPTIKIDKLELIILMVSDFSKVRITAPKTTGADKRKKI